MGDISKEGTANTLWPAKNNIWKINFSTSLLLCRYFIFIPLKSRPGNGSASPKDLWFQTQRLFRSLQSETLPEKRHHMSDTRIWARFWKVTRRPSKAAPSLKQGNSASTLASSATAEPAASSSNRPKRPSYFSTRIRPTYKGHHTCTLVRYLTHIVTQ